MTSRKKSQLCSTNVIMIAFAQEVVAWWVCSPSLILDSFHCKFVRWGNQQFELGLWFNHLLKRAPTCDLRSVLRRMVSPSSSRWNVPVTLWVQLERHFQRRQYFVDENEFLQRLRGLTRSSHIVK
jgi:hypothetical protein